MKLTKLCLLLLFCLSAGCARTRTYDDHRWECMKLYEGETRATNELSLVVVRQPMFVVNIRDVRTEEDDAIEVDEIAEEDRMLELIPDDYLITLSYREHNVMNETRRYGEPITLKFRAKTNNVYRAMLLEEFEKELDEEFEWAPGIQNGATDEIVSVPVLIKATAKSAAEATRDKLAESGSKIQLQLITNKQGRVEFRPKKK